MPVLPVLVFVAMGHISVLHLECKENSGFPSSVVTHSWNVPSPEAVKIKEVDVTRSLFNIAE